MSLKYTWQGHATHSLEVDGTKILVDPFFYREPRGCD